jgi:hypothetical protein
LRCGRRRQFLEQLRRFWLDDYDWAGRLKVLNKLPHYRATVGGCGMHFLLYRSPQPGAESLLLMNGWPSSFVEISDWHRCSRRVRRRST